jgi:hypothetical protein
MVSTRSSSATPRPSSKLSPEVEPVTPLPVRTPRRARASKASSVAGWVHTPSTATLAWLAVSLPLVAWDTGYVLGRPLTMPGGSLHWPLWVPYELYGRVDLVYGRAALEAHDGFCGAQGMLNLIESSMYLAYLYLWWTTGQSMADGARKSISGKSGALAVLIALSASVMTLSKTVLYCEPAHSILVLSDMSSLANATMTRAQRVLL